METAYGMDLSELVRLANKVMGWNGMGWDGVEWDGMKWNEME